MPCIQPMLVRNKSGQLVRVGCGKCYGCLRRKQRELALRLSLDLKYSYESLFVTLTFDDNHLIRNYIDVKTGAFYELPSITKECAQKFLKRLRKNLHYDSKRTSLMYYLTGEYGDETKRPHMHIIIYLVGQQTNVIPLAKAVECSWQFCDWNDVSREKCIQRINSDGAMMYVAKHQVKRCQGTEFQYPYFQLRSKGIGKCCFNDDKLIDFMDKNGFMYYDRTKKAAVPRYFKEKLSICVRTDGEVKKQLNEQIEKESVEFDRAWRYYHRSHPNISYETFCHKYFKKLVKDNTYNKEYYDLMYNKLKNSKL